MGNENAGTNRIEEGWRRRCWHRSREGGTPFVLPRGLCWLGGEAFHAVPHQTAGEANESAMPAGGGYTPLLTIRA